MPWVAGVDASTQSTKVELRDLTTGEGGRCVEGRRLTRLPVHLGANRLPRLGGTHLKPRWRPPSGRPVLTEGPATWSRWRSPPSSTDWWFSMLRVHRLRVSWTAGVPGRHGHATSWRWGRRYHARHLTTRGPPRTCLGAARTLRGLGATHNGHDGRRSADRTRCAADWAGAGRITVRVPRPRRPVSGPSPVPVCQAAEYHRGAVLIPGVRPMRRAAPADRTWRTCG